VLIESAEDWLSSNRIEVKTIIAEALAENIASNKLFEKSGYAVNAVWFRKSIK